MEGEIEIFCALKIEKNITGIESPNGNSNASDVSQLNSSLLCPNAENANIFSLFQLDRGSLFTPFISGNSLLNIYVNCLGKQSLFWPLFDIIKVKLRAIFNINI